MRTGMKATPEARAKMSALYALRYGWSKLPELRTAVALASAGGRCLGIRPDIGVMQKAATYRGGEFSESGVRDFYETILGTSAADFR
jgi:hypothetical protein